MDGLDAHCTVWVPAAFQPSMPLSTIFSSVPLMLVFQKWNWLLNFEFLGNLGFAFGIILNWFWKILEQLNWKKYIKIIFDIANRLYLNFMLSKQQIWALYNQCSSRTKPVLLDSNTWCASNCCSSSFFQALLSSSGWSFHSDTLWSCTDWVKAII